MMERNSKMQMPSPSTKAVEKANPMARFKRSVVNTVGDALSYPARRRAQKAILKSDTDLQDVKRVNQSKGVEPVPNDYRSELFRARANVSNLKYQSQKSALASLKNK